MNGTLSRRLAAVALLSLAAAGCAKKAGVAGTAAVPVTESAGWPNPQEVEARLPGGDEFAAGKKAYAAHGCARCHKLGDTGGGPPGGPDRPAGETPKGPGRGRQRGPDLTAVGRDPEHTADWLAAHIRDPKSHKADSRMPTFGPEKISDADLQALAAYLASRK